MDPLLEIFKNASLVTYCNGQIVDQKNTNNIDCVYYLKFGFIKVYTISNAGDEHILIILRRCDIFPLASVVFKNGNDQKIFFEALGRVKLLQITKEDLHAAINSSLHIATALLAQLGERFLTSEQHTENLLGKSAQEKLVYCIQYLATRYGHVDGDTSFLDPVFTHKLIGSTVGLTRGTVTKELKKLRLKKLIMTFRGRTHIVSLKMLSEEYGEPFTIAH